MPLQTLPLFAWGTASDISASPWTDNGTPGVAAVTDPFGASLAYTITDNDAGTAEARLNVVGACTGSLLVLAVGIKAGTATASTMQVRDQTAGAYTIQATTTWSGAVPGTPSMASGNYIGQVSLGNGWYLLVFTCAWTSGNSARLELYGASGTASATGTTSYYLRHIVLTDYLVDALGYDEDGEGSDYRVGPSGVEEAWSTGTRYGMGATIGWIPSAPRSNPVVVSGWPGGAEYAGVNDGIAAMLRAGRNKNALTFVPDRSACDTGAVSCYLEEPLKPRPELDPDNQNEKRIAIRVRSSSPFGAI